MADPLSIPVLVVEDSPEMVMLYRSFLAGSGFQPFFASTTRQAEQILDWRRPAVILLDIVLRAEEAWSFVAQLNNEPRTKDIPVLIVSTLEDQAKAYHLGATDYLVKPIQRAVLIERLRAALGPSLPAHVLIIDDDESDRYLIRQRLLGSRVYVTEAFDGAQGIRQACEETPQGIILDLNMPGMSGFEVLDRLKAETSTKDIPVVVCTSRVLTETERLQLSQKTSAVLNKQGLDHAALAQVLNRILSVSDVAAAAIG
jgi:CheY-like chemotaxis protein